MQYSIHDFQYMELNPVLTSMSLVYTGSACGCWDHFGVSFHGERVSSKLMPHFKQTSKMVTIWEMNKNSHQTSVNSQSLKKSCASAHSGTPPKLSTTPPRLGFPLCKMNGLHGEAAGEVSEREPVNGQRLQRTRRRTTQWPHFLNGKASHGCPAARVTRKWATTAQRLRMSYLTREDIYSPHQLDVL